MYKRSFVSFLFFFAVLPCFAQSSWVLKTEQEGIRVYTRPVAASKFKAIRVECEMGATLSQLVAVLLDVGTCTQWVYHTKTCRLLKQVSPSELYYYSQVSVPWPAEDRDFVAHVQFNQDPATRVVTMNAPCVQGWVPVQSGVVRIEHSTGRWIIRPAGKDRVKIEYELEADPGGDVPAWLTNLFVAQGPLQSFKSLRNELKKPAYRNAKLEFIKDE